MQPTFPNTKPIQISTFHCNFYEIEFLIKKCWEIILFQGSKSRLSMGLWSPEEWLGTTGLHTYIPSLCSRHFWLSSLGAVLSLLFQHYFIVITRNFFAGNFSAKCRISALYYKMVPKCPKSKCSNISFGFQTQIFVEIRTKTFWFPKF